MTFDNENMDFVTNLKWNNISWKNVDSNVKNLRFRIFKATKENNYTSVRRLQKLLLKSFSNVLYSTRRVTIKGKGTPGVDEYVALTSEERMKIALQIHSMNLKEWKPSPALRVYIPKPDGRQKPLGIPTIIDRILQGIVLNALEPEWEA